MHRESPSRRMMGAGGVEADSTEVPRAFQPWGAEERARRNASSRALAEANGSRGKAVFSLGAPVGRIAARDFHLPDGRDDVCLLDCGVGLGEGLLQVVEVARITVFSEIRDAVAT